MEHLKGLDIGAVKHKGSTDIIGSEINILAGGSDIWETSDQFHFAQQAHQGDFDFQGKVTSLGLSHPFAKAGLMLRDSLSADAALIFFFVFPDNRPRNNNNGGYEGHFRSTPGAKCTAIYPPGKGKGDLEFPVLFPSGWLRLVRKNEDWSTYTSVDGKNWELFAKWTLSFPQAGFLGLAVTAHDNDKSVKATFTNLKLS